MNFHQIGSRSSGKHPSPRAALVSLAILLLAGCGSASNSTSSTPAKSNATSNPNVAQAQALLGPYTGRPSAFPVTEPLAKKLPAGSTIVFMDCGTPVCALFRELVTPAAQAMGVKLAVIKAGATAARVNAAFQTVVQMHPAAVINTALDPVLWSQALKTLEADKIPIISTGVVDGARYGLTTYPNMAIAGAPWATLSGRLQAAWVYAQVGSKANVQYNWVPELSFSPLVRDAFISELKALCPSCQVHTLSIPVSDLGSTAPNLIVSDLQSHPGTNVVVGSNSEQLLGLPAALKAAGLAHITTLGAVPTPINLEYIKAGQQTADLGADLPVASWMLVDAAVRAATHEPFPAAEAAGVPPMQFLGQKDIMFDPSKGWTGYPDFAKRFISLWAAAK
jgi:ribose transport system substrate-binding protein